MSFHRFLLVSLAGMCCAPALGQRHSPIAAITPELRPVSYDIPMGQPVWVRFTLRNTSDDSITLSVPGTEPAIPSPESGLPVSHVFSGGVDSGLSLTSPSGRRWDEPSGYRLPARAPLLIIAPRSSVGVTLDLRESFPALRGAGQYRITWRPYAGAAGEQTQVISVGQLKRAEIVTDEGTMVMRFFYGDAPSHIDNFIDLVESGFYNGKLFHRIEQGYFLQGGCPRGDGTGIRPDGKRVAAEFNGHPMRKGAVAMALLGDDPNSASCQFFICNTRHKDWDGRYTIFGELVGEGSYATLDRLMASPIDETGRPSRPLYMRTVRIIDGPAEDVR